MDFSLDLIPYKLHFKFSAGTSRGVLNHKTSFFLLLKDSQNKLLGVGEAGPLPKLSTDDFSDFLVLGKQIIEKIIFPPHFDSIQRIYEFAERVIPYNFPSLRFALETALLDYRNGSKRVIFENQFSSGHQSILINGLIWMGDEQFMKQQIEAKLKEGFRCLKLKIGSLNFETECSIIQSIRNQFASSDLELRVDANGAFTPKEAMNKLKRLSTFDIHSIEQPIKAGQIEAMAQLCRNTPLPIALDEELIGITSFADKKRLIEEIHPQYIILKPTLLGGFKATDEWITLSEDNKIPWWITSALESNIGLNAISQYSASFKNSLPQGLGTGQLYTNNLQSPLTLTGQYLSYNKNSVKWNLTTIEEGF